MSAPPAVDVDTAPRWLRGAAWVWLVVAVVLGSAGMAASYRNPDLLRIAAFARLYRRLGLSDEVMITVVLVLPLVAAAGAAVLILVRRGLSRAAVVLAMCLVATYLFVSGAALGVGALWVRNLVASTAMVLMAVFLVGFPTGSFRPRWSALAPGVVLVAGLAWPDLAWRSRAMLGGAAQAGDRALTLVVWGIVLVMAIAAQIARRRRFSTDEQRHQMRWVLLALLLMLAPPLVLLGLIATGQGGTVAAGLLVLASALGSYALPVAVGVAVFRYHLYEIDRIISRTVTYGTLAAVVAAIYAGLVVVASSVVGPGNDVAIAAATLAAAAAFNPLHHRLRETVDRRFDRVRYDATREIETLARRLQSGTSGALERDVVSLVSRTLHPASVAVWVADP